MERTVFQSISQKHVLSLGPRASVREAAGAMTRANCGSVLIMEPPHTLLGIVTERDLMTRVLAKALDPEKTTVREIMTPNPYTVSEATPLTELVQLMERHRIKRVPVVCGRRLVGIVSRADLLRALARLAPAAETVATNDAEIRERVMAELRKQSWAPLDLINVIVRDRTVDLQGTITDDGARQAKVVAAENVPGVRAVQDHLVWVEPLSGMTVLPQDASAASVNAS